MGLASQFQERVASYKEYRRLVDREKGMIDPSAIILPDDFYLTAADPLIARKTYMGDLFKRDWRAMKKEIEKKATEGKVTSFGMSYDCLEPLMQTHYKRLFAQDNMHEIGFSVEQTFHVAVYAKDLFHIINDRYIQPDAIGMREIISIGIGEGEAVLNFWRDVRRIKDYSGFFPDKPKLPRNDKSSKPERVKAFGLKPSWGGSF